ncbi:MAG: class I SAM-dependent methyltransferase, partial [Nanoarchaeota archaeon]
MENRDFSTVERGSIDKLVARARHMAGHPQKGYYRESSLEKYAIFSPSGYRGIQDLVDRVIRQKGSCRALELCCGDGYAGRQLLDMYGQRIDYTGVDVVQPSHDVRWMNSSVDDFEPEGGYDLIISINGIIYGNNDLRNLFKYANALSRDGMITFNFDGRTNPLQAKKVN